MSTKTLKKRIAVVAISALTAGVFSVVSAPVATAALQKTMGNGTLVLGNISSISGSATAYAPAGGADVNTTTMRSVGWVTDTSSTVSVTDGGNFANGSATKTANVLPGAAISFAAFGTSTAAEGFTVTVTGGSMSSLTATQGGATSGLGGGAAITLTNAMVSTGTTTVTINDTSFSEIVGGVFNVTAAVGGTATIAIYGGTAIDDLSTATSGVYLGGYVLTVVSAADTGTFNAGESKVYQQACMANVTTGTSTELSYDTTSRCTNGTAGVIWTSLKDKYGVALNSGTLTATASAGQVIGSQTSSTGAAINAAVASFSTISVDSNGDAWFYVKQPVANTAGSSTVTITLNGVVIGTKTISWQGTVATLTVDEANSCKIFSTNQLTDTQEGNVGDACVVYVAKDAAGNVVTLSAQPSISDATGALVGTATSTLTASSGYAVVQSSSVGYGFTTLLIPANALSGAGGYQLELTNANLTKVKSQMVNVTVSRGSTNSFKASWDKASYNYGDIATLTIELKDAYGNLMANGTALTGLDLTVNTGGFTATGAACTAASTVTAGVKTCKYSALNTEGAYAFSVDVTTATPQDASIGTLPVKPSTTAVSNADVLKSIVALIASINKQIQALQKLILRR
jgi:hypothetical protein